jgi:hypothetical protein
MQIYAFAIVFTNFSKRLGQHSHVLSLHNGQLDDPLSPLMVTVYSLYVFV